MGGACRPHRQAWRDFKSYSHILNRLGLAPGRFLHHMGGKSKLTHHLTAIGSLDRMQALAKKMGQSILKGNGLARYFVLRRRVAGKDSVAYHVANFKSRNKLVLLLRSGVVCGVERAVAVSQFGARLGQYLPLI